MGLPDRVFHEVTQKARWCAVKCVWSLSVFYFPRLRGLIYDIKITVKGDHILHFPRPSPN